jgi:hypothetical protein
VGGGVREEVEGKRLERVAHEDGGRLVPLAVDGGLAAPQVVVVHAGQVVVDEAVGVERLDRRRRADGATGVGDAEERGGFDDEEAAEALAAVGGVAHPLHDREGAVGGEHRVEAGLDLRAARRQPGGEGHSPSTGRRALRLAVRVERDERDLLLGRLQPLLAMRLERRSAFVKGDGLLEIHVAGFELAHDPLELGHGLLEAHVPDRLFRHAPRSISTRTWAATDSPRASRS